MTTNVTFEPVEAADADELASLRVEAMRDSLERVGRFDPQRARDRFLLAFLPEHTQHILCDGHRVGFRVVRPEPDGLRLDHFYVRPAHQGRGIGAAALTDLLQRADRERLVIRLGALRGSDSNRFYQRHGFVQVGQSEFDNHYERLPRATPH